MGCNNGFGAWYPGIDADMAAAYASDAAGRARDSARDNESRLKHIETKVLPELHLTTSLLCEQCRSMERAGQAFTPELQAWWSAHKDYDKSQGR